MREKLAGLDVFRFRSGFHSTDRDVGILLKAYDEFITLNEEEDKNCEETVLYLLRPTNFVTEIREVLGRSFQRLLSQLI